MHALPSQWVVSHAPLIRSGGRVLDLACGSGRHAIWLAEHGYQVTALDRDSTALAHMQSITNIQVVECDIESGNGPASWAASLGYAHPSYDGIVVTRYLFRPVLAKLAAMLNPGGVLIYETFMQGHEQFGRPSNPEYLLAPEELKTVYGPLLQIHAFEQGKFNDPLPAMLQRICAMNVRAASARNCKSSYQDDEHSAAKA